MFGSPATVICSATMMHGYWNRPDLNARAFYRHSSSCRRKHTYYRTGDLVQLGDDGNYRFIGRKDRQIKTRGYRVELDEVEAGLLAHGKIAEAAAFPVADDEAGNLIEAAVILREDAVATSLDLRAHLKARLPWYAVPRSIEVVDAFPRTPTGKIDRPRLWGRLSAIRACPGHQSSTEV